MLRMLTIVLRACADRQSHCRLAAHAAEDGRVLHAAAQDVDHAHRRRLRLAQATHSRQLMQ